jgi:hypothetical protein
MLGKIQLLLLENGGFFEWHDTDTEAHARAPAARVAKALDLPLLSVLAISSARLEQLKKLLPFGIAVWSNTWTALEPRPNLGKPRPPEELFKTNIIYYSDEFVLATHLAIYKEQRTSNAHRNSPPRA